MLFTPGPTEMEEEILRIGASPLPYFRSAEYCQQILELTGDLKWLFGTRTTPLTITGSGTAGMEMALVNLFKPGDKVVSINAGTFGAKWAVMARGLGLDVHEISMAHGQNPDLQQIHAAIGADTKGILLTAHETSTGYLFNIKEICASLKNSHCLTVVDAVSSIGADEFQMDEWSCDCAIACSQKALACMPGLVFVAFSERAQEILKNNPNHRSYLDARTYYENIVRGMLPFTPAMHATFQVAHRLAKIREQGLAHHLAALAAKADAFRAAMIAHEGFGIFPQRSSNALSTITLPAGVHAADLVKRLKEKYQAILPMNPTGAENFIRVSHMGALDQESLGKLAEWIVQESH